MGIVPGLFVGGERYVGERTTMGFPKKGVPFQGVGKLLVVLVVHQGGRIGDRGSVNGAMPLEGHVA